METKQFSLQSPEQIAKDYGGNKQKIAQAASMGMVDPTAAVLAGMFIDRMRSAQMLEQQPQGTVAQQVFQPQQAPQGAAPQGAPPPMGAPPMGAPPMGAPPPPQPPGMAMGGLMDLSVPDDMFSEPTTDAENFAGGGLVAFAMGGKADEDDEDELTLGDRLREQFRGPEDPTYYGRPMTAADMRGAFGIPEKRDPAYVPFLGAETGVTKFATAPLIGAVRATAGMMRRGGDESFAREQYEKAMAKYNRERAAYDAAAATNLRVGAVGGGRKQALPPKPVAPKRQDFEAADFAPAPRPALAPTAKPAASPRAGSATPAPFRQQDSRSEATRPAPSAVSGPAAPRPGTGVAPSPRVAMTPPTAPSGLGAIATPQGGPRAPVPGAPTVPGAPSAPQAPAGPTGIEGYMAQYQQLMGPQAATPYRDQLAAAAEAQRDPKNIAAQKKQDMWQAVAQFGFNMAATNSPSFMQAAGQAGAATVPFMAASRKERRAMERDALKQLADIEGLTAAEKKQALRDGFAFATRQAEQDEEMAYKYDVLNENKRENRVREGLAAARGSGGGGSGGGGGLGAPDFPGGALGAFATSRYQDIMALMGEKLKANPKAMAAYAADPAGYEARYRRAAYREALRLGKQDAEGDGGGGGRRSERAGGGDPYAGYSATVKQ
jgi:hypothetical protein